MNMEGSSRFLGTTSDDAIRSSGAYGREASDHRAVGDVSLSRIAAKMLGESR
jgi:hypothetical protein